VSAWLRCNCRVPKPARQTVSDGGVSHGGILMLLRAAGFSLRRRIWPSRVAGHRPRDCMYGGRLLDTRSYFADVGRVRGKRHSSRVFLTALL